MGEGSGKKSNDAGENLRADSCSNLKNDYHRNSRGSNKGKNIMIELIEDFIFSSGKDKSPIIEGKDLMSNLGFTLQVNVGTISNPLIPIGPDGPYSLDPMNGLKFGLAMDSGTQSNISLVLNGKRFFQIRREWNGRYRRFHNEACWADKEDGKKVICDSWGVIGLSSGIRDVALKMNNCAKSLEMWYQTHRKALQIEIKKKKVELAAMSNDVNLNS
ncbi:hypothetical protein QYF36_022275 [Acer negundo]|nr:hypothetical protein QYF36_022275 [Acer negundo]